MDTTDHPQDCKCAVCRVKRRKQAATAVKEPPSARRSAAACSENPSRDQLAIAFGKWMAGYRPGVDAEWNELDQAAYDYVMEGSFISQNAELTHPESKP